MLLVIDDQVLVNAILCLSVVVVVLKIQHETEHV